MVRRRPGSGAIALAAFLLVAPALGGIAVGPTPSLAPAWSTFAGGTPCTGGHILSRIPGTLGTDDPYGTVPSVAGVNVTLDYEYQANTSGPIGPTVTCWSANVSAVTSADGAFEVQPVVPAGSCSGKWCTVTSGPFGPMSLHLNRTDPPGDFLRTFWRGVHVDLVWTGAFASVAVDPAGPVVTSTDDPFTVTASAFAGDGSPSPANLSFAWSVTGASWSRTTNTSGPSTTVRSTGAGGTGSVSVRVTGTYNGTAMGTLTSEVSLTSVATKIVSVGRPPVAVDVGEPVPFELVGDGARGFGYNASVLPSAGGDPVPLRCATSAGGPSDVVVDCNGTVSWSSAGVARPSASLSNGYDAVNVSVANVSVDPPPAFTFTPDPAVGYAGSAIDFDVAMDPATGTGPDGPACLSDGAGTVHCAPVGGTNWTFRVDYTDPGQYVARASVIDAVGVNQSESVDVTVADAPGLGPLGDAGSSAYVGVPVDLSANLSGGLWPATYYWNDSVASGALEEGLVESDGTLRFAFDPSTAGPQTVSLVLVDAGGRRVASAVNLTVDPGAPVRWEDSVGGSSLAATAGVAVGFTVRAVDAAGETVASYAPALALRAAGRSDPDALSVVTGGSGPRPRGDAGAWNLSSADWSPGGTLDVIVESNRTGAWELNLSNPSDPGATPLELLLTVGPDLAAPQLRNATDVRSGERSGATLYAIVDPYGNPILAGYVVVRSTFPSGTLVVDTPVEVRDGAGSVWINYTAIGDGAGTVQVESAVGAPLLPPIHVPAIAAPGDPWTGAYVLGGSGVLLGAALILWVRGRARRAPGPDVEGELERHAAGRDHVLRRLADGPTSDLDGLSEGWTGPPPRPERAEIAEWVAGLVADGVVRARRDRQGTVELSRDDGAPAPPDLYLDAAALESALSHRDAPEGPVEPTDDGPT